LEDRTINGSLKVNIKEKEKVGCGLDSSSLEYRPVVSFCEYGNEPSGSITITEYVRIEITR
jgi:hypothetical protein